MSRARPTRLTPEQARALTQKMSRANIKPFATHATHSRSSIEDPLELIYSLRTGVFRLERASMIHAPPAPTAHRVSTPDDEDPEANPYTLLSPTIAASSVRSNPYTIPKHKRRVSPSRIFKTPLLSYRNLSDNSIPTASQPLVKRPCQEERAVPMLEVPGNMPPMLVDGRKFNVQIPRWKKSVDFVWRQNDGAKTQLLVRKQRLPGWVWRARNLQLRVEKGGIKHGRWTEFWVERG